MPLIIDTPPTIISLVTCTLLDGGNLGVVTGVLRANILLYMQVICSFLEEMIIGFSESYESFNEQLIYHGAVCRTARHCIEIPFVKSLECVEVFV